MGFSKLFSRVLVLVLHHILLSSSHNQQHGQVLALVTTSRPQLSRGGASSRGGTSLAAAAATATNALNKRIETNTVVTRVAVAGATGRVGRLVIEELLRRNVQQVVGIVRDEKKADELFGSVDSNNRPKNLEIIQVDLLNEKEIDAALNGVDAAIWCATGFSDNEEVDPIEKIKRLFGIAVTPKRSIDFAGVPAFAKSLLKQDEGTTKSKKDKASQSPQNPFFGNTSPKKSGTTSAATSGPLPKLVMLSSAGVTRSTWDAAKKKKLEGAADIPIVRLNPFGILDVKRQSEDLLRQSGVEYCIFRPCGLNDKAPAGSRPVFSQGDVSVGRINRQDVAEILVDCLTTPEATGKTFEAIGLAGYAKSVSIRPALARLVRDDDEQPSEEIVEATYNVLQQILPGEQQDAAKLAMGQTYEQLDRGEVGRLGKRGQEDTAQIFRESSS